MIDPTEIKLTVDGKCQSISAWPELYLTMQPVHQTDDSVQYALHLKNTGTLPVRIEKVQLVYRDASFFQGSAADLRFYKEGLTAVGVAGSLSADDCDVELDPGFLHLTVSDPPSYAWDQPGKIHAEYVGVLMNLVLNQAWLFGFVTAHRFCCRVELDATGDQGMVISNVIDTDGLSLLPDQEWQLESLMIKHGTDVQSMLEAYAHTLGSNMQARVSEQSPGGWCSYYFYYGQETEDDILENAQFLKDNRGRLDVDIVQIDDGWQRARGDWFDSHPEKFPHGMAWLAERIRAYGLRPGLWVAPLLVAKNSSLFTEHSDWLLSDATGELMNMGDNCFLDPTHPQALAWIGQVFNNMRQWGFDYFKLDFLFVASAFGGKYHDPTQSRLQAYRNVLKVIRQAVGEDAYLLGGTALIAANVGLVDGCRIGTDVTPFWSHSECTPESPAIVNVCRNLINRGYQHHRLWHNDPDCLIVREMHGRAKYAAIPSLTLPETHMLASAMILSGGSLFLGDRLSALPFERLAVIEQVLSLSDGHAAIPLDRMQQLVPSIWLRQGDGTHAKPHLLGLFNWCEDQTQLTVQQSQLAFNELDKPVQIQPIWDDQFVEIVKDRLEATLPAHSCALIKVWQSLRK